MDGKAAAAAVGDEESRGGRGRRGADALAGRRKRDYRPVRAASADSIIPRLQRDRRLPARSLARSADRPTGPAPSTAQLGPHCV